MKTHYFGIILMLSLLISCGKKSTNQVEATDAQLATYQDGDSVVNIDVNNSVVHWKGFKPGGSHHGTLGIKSGEMTIIGNKLKAGTFILDMDKIICEDLTADQGNDKLVAHLKSPDFFDVAKHPEGKFMITQVEELGTGDYSHRIYGNLELKGITKNIHFDAKITKEGNIYAGNTATFSIDRTQWGVNYGSKNIFKDLKDAFINDEIEISIKIATK